jgi:DNA-directed RNA polymerase specialized sigma24 family protein
MSTDEELLKGIKRGDHDSVLEFSDRYFAPLFAYVQYLGPHPSLAEAHTYHLLDQIVGHAYPRRSDRKLSVRAWFFKEVRRRIQSTRREALEGSDPGTKVEIGPSDAALLAEIRAVPKLWIEAVFLVRLLQISFAEAAQVMGEPKVEVRECVENGIEDLRQRHQRAGG